MDQEQSLHHADVIREIQELIANAPNPLDIGLAGRGVPPVTDIIPKFPKLNDDAKRKAIREHRQRLQQELEADLEHFNDLLIRGAEALDEVDIGLEGPVSAFKSSLKLTENHISHQNARLDALDRALDRLDGRNEIEPEYVQVHEHLQDQVQSGESDLSEVERRHWQIQRALEDFNEGAIHVPAELWPQSSVQSFGSGTLADIGEADGIHYAVTGLMHHRDLSRASGARVVEPDLWPGKTVTYEQEIKLADQGLHDRGQLYGTAATHRGKSLVVLESFNVYGHSQSYYEQALQDLEGRFPEADFKPLQSLDRESDLSPDHYAQWTRDQLEAFEKRRLENLAKEQPVADLFGTENEDSEPDTFSDESTWSLLYSVDELNAFQYANWLFSHERALRAPHRNQLKQEILSYAAGKSEGVDPEAREYLLSLRGLAGYSGLRDEIHSGHEVEVATKKAVFAVSRDDRGEYLVRTMPDGEEHLRFRTFYGFAHYLLVAANGLMTNRLERSKDAQMKVETLKSEEIPAESADSPPVQQKINPAIERLIDKFDVDGPVLSAEDGVLVRGPSPDIVNRYGQNALPYAARIPGEAAPYYGATPEEAKAAALSPVESKSSGHDGRRSPGEESQYDRYYRFIEESSVEMLRKCPGIKEEIAFDGRLTDCETEDLEKKWDTKLEQRSGPLPEVVDNSDVNPGERLVRLGGSIIATFCVNDNGVVYQVKHRAQSSAISDLAYEAIEQYAGVPNRSLQQRGERKVKAKAAEQPSSTGTHHVNVVNVASFRRAIDHLERIYNQDRHSCVGLQELTAWRVTAERVLEQLLVTECSRAKPDDRRRKQEIVDRVQAYFRDNPPPVSERAPQQESTPVTPTFSTDQVETSVDEPGVAGAGIYGSLLSNRDQLNEAQSAVTEKVAQCAIADGRQTAINLFRGGKLDKHVVGLVMRDGSPSFFVIPPKGAFIPVTGSAASELIERMKDPACTRLPLFHASGQAAVDRHEQVRQPEAAQSMTLQ